MNRIGRNDPCPCGSGKKYKNCCMYEDQQEKLKRKKEFVSDSIVPITETSHEDDISNDQSEEVNMFDEFWERYETADFDEKVTMIKEMYNDPSLLESDFVYEVLTELNESATTKSERDMYRTMVMILKATHSGVYEEEAGFLLDRCIANAVMDEEIDELKPLFLEYTEYADEIIDIFKLRADQLAYHGHLTLLREGYRKAWPKVMNSDDILQWGKDEFAERGMDYELFHYILNSENPQHDDNELLKRIEYYTSLDKTMFDTYFKSITRRSSRIWTFEDFTFSRKMEEEVLFDSDIATNITDLCDEFLDYLYKEEKISYSKAELMRTEIREYLIQRLEGDFNLQSKAKRRKSDDIEIDEIVSVLCPDRLTIDQCLTQLLDFLNCRIYRAVALFESVPHWLEFLEMNGLIDSSAQTQVQNSIFTLYSTLEYVLTQQELNDKFAMESIKSAWNA